MKPLEPPPSLVAIVKEDKPAFVWQTWFSRLHAMVVLSFNAVILIRDTVYEQAGMRNSSTLSLTYLVNWATGSVNNDDSLIQFNITTGVITIGEDGDYAISAYVHQTGGNNNENYSWGIEINDGLADMFLGDLEWTNKTNGQVAYASAVINLFEGDTLQVKAYDSQAAITFGNTDFQVRKVL